MAGGLPGGPVVNTLPSNVRSILGQGTEISHVSQPKKSKHKTKAIL